jgi:PQQ-like domain
MHARTLVLLLLAFAGCKKPEQPPAAAAPLDRRARCEKIGEQMTQMGVVFARGMVSGLSEGKQTLAGDEQHELQAELETATAELVEQCMLWPEEVMGCFGAGALFDSETCERLIAEVMGEAVPPTDVPAGPAPAWSFTLPQDQSILHGCADGSALVVTEMEVGGTLLSIADGKQRWRVPLTVSPWSIESLDDESVLLVLPRELVAISIRDGAERWRASMPPGELDPGPVAVLRERDGFTLLDDAGRLFRIESSRCANGPCITTIGELPADDPETRIGLELSGAIDLIRLADGNPMIAAYDEHRAVALDAKLRPRFAIESHAAMSWVQQRGDELVVALDGEVLALDPSKCGSDGVTIAPASWPPVGKPEWLREVTVREGSWSQPPAGCVRWRLALPIAELADAPVPGFDDAMIVQAGGFLVALSSSAELWRSATAAQSLAVRQGDAIAVLGDIGSGDTELALMWLSPHDGSHLARTKLALGKGEYFLLGGPVLERAGTLVIAGLERELVAFAR